MSPKSMQHQKDEMLREYYQRNIWRWYMKEERFSELADDDIFREVAANFVAIDKKRPTYIPHKFYKTVVWNRHIAEDHLRTIDIAIQQNRGTRRSIMNKISYLTNLVSDNLLLESFYTQNGEKAELLVEMMSLSIQAAEWAESHKTSGNQDAVVAKKLHNHLAESCALLMESADIRFNLQMRWEQHLQELLGDAYKPWRTVEQINEGGDKVNVSPHFVDFASALHAMSQYLEEIAPSVSKKKSLVKKMHSQDAIVHYVARGLKELFEKYRVSKRQHIKYITDIVNVVMKENTSDERIRKLVT